MEYMILDINLKVPYTKCNYHCRYCVIKDKTKDLSKKEILKLENICEEIGQLPYSCNVIIETGGEPLISESLKRSIRELSFKKNVIGVNITSNLSLPKEKLKEFLKKIDAEKLSFNCSYHPDQVKDLEEFIEKVKLLKLPIVVGVAHPELIPHLLEVKERMKKESILMTFNPMFGSYKGKEYPYSYNERERKAVMTSILSPYEWTQGMGQKTKGKLCYAGLNSICVDIDSNVYRCRPYSRKAKFLRFSPFFLGKLKNFKLLKSPKACILKKCPCPRDFVNLKEFTDSYKRTRNYRIFFKDKKDYQFLDYNKTT